MATLDTRDRSLRYCYYGLVAAVTAAFGLMYALMPRAGDDYWFMAGVMDNARTDGSTDWLRGFCECWRWHIYNDNSRLSNILGPLTLFLPRWIPAMVSTAAVAWSLTLLGRMVGGSRPWRRPAAFSVVAAAFVLALPWWECVFTAVFAYNYLWPTPVMLWLMLWLSRLPRRRAWLMALIGMSFGAWHEIFSLPLLGGTVVLMLLSRRHRRLDVAAMAAGMLAGCAWVLLSPSVINRTGYWHRVHPLSEEYHILWWLVAAGAFLLLAAASLLVRRMRPRVLHPYTVIIACYAGVCAVSLVVSQAIRAAWPIYLLAYVGIVHLMLGLWRGLRRPGRGAMAFSAAVWAFLLTHLAVAVPVAFTIHRQEQAIVAEYERTQGRVRPIVADFLLPQDAPILAFGKPYTGLYSYYWHTGNMADYYNWPRPELLPRALAHYRAGMGAPVPGNLHARCYRGYFVAPMQECFAFPITAGKIDYGMRLDINVLYCVRFRGADGGDYVYITPQQAPLQWLLGRSPSINARYPDRCVPIAEE